MTGSSELNVSYLPVLDMDMVSKVTGYDKESLSEINKSGVWRVMSGSRGYLDEIEYIGPLEMEAVSIPSEKECFEMLVSSDATEEEIEDTAMYVEEFYGIVEQNETVMFSYTEEEYDMYVKVKI